MFKRNLAKMVGGMLLGAIAVLAVLPACAGSTPAPAVPQATATAQQPTPTAAPAGQPTPAAAPARQPTPPVAPAPTPTPTAVASLQGSPPASADLLAKGKLIFEKTAGGVGCAYCHGLDGKGQGTSGVAAPDNRGATEAQVRDALLRVTMMSFIKLGDEEIKALVAYLQYLAKQP